ncbi:MAG: hypothetical protein ACJ747_06010 [Gaiellaceae bacterium]|jgi:hypothetical protein
MKHLLHRWWKVLVPTAVLAFVVAGVAVGATRTASSGGTNVCVNDVNGLVRVATSCRDGEHPLTIGGGGGNTQATQKGTFSVPIGQTAGAKRLPLTGVTISGRCTTIPGPGPGIGGFLVFDAATGTTMDLFPNGGVGVTSATIFAGGLPPGFTFTQFSEQTVVMTSNGATASITIGGSADPTAGTCTFLWQAVEAPN